MDPHERGTHRHVPIGDQGVRAGADRVKNTSSNETTSISKETNMEKFLENLKTQAEENPVLALGVAAGLITAISKLVEAHSGTRNSKAWDRETARRAMKDTRKSK